jgi:hypothetical protein
MVCRGTRGQSGRGEGGVWVQAKGSASSPQPLSLAPRIIDNSIIPGEPFLAAELPWPLTQRTWRRGGSWVVVLLPWQAKALRHYLSHHIFHLERLQIRSLRDDPSSAYVEVHRLQLIILLMNTK